MERCGPVRAPTVHVMGKEDFMHGLSRQSVAAYDPAQCTLLEHGFGHVFPPFKEKLLYGQWALAVQAALRAPAGCGSAVAIAALPSAAAPPASDSAAAAAASASSSSSSSSAAAEAAALVLPSASAPPAPPVAVEGSAGCGSHV